jgi:hypothetical protein
MEPRMNWMGDGGGCRREEAKPWWDAVGVLGSGDVGRDFGIGKEPKEILGAAGERVKFEKRAGILAMGPRVFNGRRRRV